MAWRRADLKKQANQKREDRSKADPLDFYGEKQKRLNRGTDDEIPRKKIKSTWQWNAQLAGSEEQGARKNAANKAELASVKTARWRQQPNNIWTPVLRHDSTDKAASS